jgi:hypothetical protein
MVVAFEPICVPTMSFSTVVTYVIDIGEGDLQKTIHVVTQSLSAKELLPDLHHFRLFPLALKAGKRNNFAAHCVKKSNPNMTGYI